MKSDMIQQIKRSLLADRRKLTVMAALLAVALLLWGRILVQRVPREASARPTTATQTTGQEGEATGVANAADLPVIYADLDPALARDLFAIDLDRFALIPQPVQDSITEEKSPPQRADDEDTARLAAALRLDSTVLSDPPRAMINGTPVTAGQQVRGFTVIEIRHRSVIVERNGQRYVIRM